MKSIKPGRGPSFMGGIGSAAAAVFGVIWTLFALSMGAPVIFALFGVVFVAMGVMQAIYNFKNATSKDRYSSFDITSDSEEPDPLNERFGRQEDEPFPPTLGGNEENGNFCPYCGAKIKPDYEFCKQCGKKI